MAKLCFRCEKNIPGEPEGISFVYKGFKFTVFKNGMECAECAKRGHIKDFKKYGKGLISVEESEPRVNWQVYVDKYSSDRDKIRDKINDILISLGVFSLKSKGNWGIIADGPIGLNPRFHITYLYFTRKEDAVEFARLKYSQTFYGWEIHHVDEVLKKGDIIK